MVLTVSLALSVSCRLALDMPDNLHMMEAVEGAQDPFFGLMESQQLPSPYKILQVLHIYHGHRYYIHIKSYNHKLHICCCIV